MSLIDDFLLGRGRERRRVGDSLLQDFMNRQVTKITDKGLVFEQHNNSGANLGAATALQRTTGQIPQGFFNGISDNAPNTAGSSVLAFPDAERGAIFKRLTEAGIKPGTSVSDLQNILKQQGNEDLSQMLQRMIGNNTGPVDGKRQAFGSSDAGSGRASSDGFASLVRSFVNGYKQDKNANPKQNNDVGSFGNYMETVGSKGNVDNTAHHLGPWMR